MRLAIQGVGASRGLVLGRARVREPHAIDVDASNIAAENVDLEIARIERAVMIAREQMASTREELQGAVGQDLGDLLDLHGLLLEDPELLDGLRDLIQTGRYGAEYALRLQRDRLASVFSAVDDPYLRSRQEDIDHAIGQIYAALHAREQGNDTFRSGDILVATTVSPSELADLHRRGVIAVVAAKGSTLSHSAILARSLHIPLVVGAQDAIQRINEGDALIVDAAGGQVIVEPDGGDLRNYRRRIVQLRKERRQLERLRHAPTRTQDGRDITLYANAASPEDISDALAMDAAGVGLFRTEFLFLERERLPDENEQFRSYREAVLGMRGRVVTIRTLDLGGDKSRAIFSRLLDEENPALGLRGIRLTLASPHVLTTQIRAILRASAFGPVRILVPMVSTREEVLAVRRIVQRCAHELHAEGQLQTLHVQLGVMIEVPVAALSIVDFADLVDFIAVGTNDLVQYLVAADRNNDAVSELNSPLHPAMLRLLHQIIRTANACRIPVSVCGEMAGDPSMTRLLLTLGLTEFSLHPSSFLEVRQQIRASHRGRLLRRCASLLRARDRDGVNAWLARG